MAAPIMVWVLVMTMHFTQMGGGGDGEFTLKFTSEDLCKSVRRAIWSQLRDADGSLGNCVQIVVPNIIIPKIE